MALDDERSTKYRRECNKKLQEIDYNKINGLTHENLLSKFYKIKTLNKSRNGWEFDYDQNDFIGNKVDIDLVDATNGKVYLKSSEKFNVVIAKSLEKDSVKKLFISNEGIIGSYLANDIFDKNNGIIFSKLVTKLHKKLSISLSRKT